MTTGMDAFWAWNDMIYWSIVTFGVVMVISAISQPWFSPKRDKTWLLAILVGIFYIWLFGGMPIPYHSGGDREIYAGAFHRLSTMTSFDTGYGDKGFYYFTYLLGKIIDLKLYFYVVAMLYIGNYLIVSKRLCQGDAMWMFAACILSMSFSSYGINTIRGGLALSIVLVGITFYREWFKMGLIFALALTIHFSTVIPILMVVATKFYDNSKLYFSLWGVSVILSFVSGEYFNNLFQGLSDDGRTGYLAGYDDHYNYNVGFRIDFIIYSLLPMIVGYYYIYKQGFHDKLYSIFFNSYILTNIFWVLVIRANFSDRFAYLSWFMIPIVLVYPLLSNQKIVKRPGVWLGAIFTGETLFKLFF